MSFSLKFQLLCQPFPIRNSSCNPLLYSAFLKTPNINHIHKHIRLNLIYILLLFARMAKSELLSAAQPPEQLQSHAVEVGATFAFGVLSPLFVYFHSACLPYTLYQQLYQSPQEAQSTILALPVPSQSLKFS